MKLEQFSRLMKQIPYGKKLPTAVYLAPTDPSSLPKELVATIQRAVVAAKPDSAWNLLKLHTDQVAITFLSYTDFEDDPHPALAEATKINLNTGTVVRTDYRGRTNPPILHRKETFLPPRHPRGTEYAALTTAEEQAGLYREPSRIGLRLYWHTLLKRLRLSHDGHRLVELGNGSAIMASEAEATAEVARHRTAIKRYDLSKPVKTLLERGLLRKQETFFDFGCGYGMDVEALVNLGYRASGWDPAFRPNAEKQKATVVNLGYVLNVIEESKERIAALQEAFTLAQKLLIVSTLAAGQETDAHSRPYRDGFLTKTNTFQKFYAPGELESLLENTLGVEVITLGLGMCAVFRDPVEAELFEAGRSRRRIDWTEISAQLRFSAPETRVRRNVGRYELHKELFDQFWQAMLDLGRVPELGEFERLAELKKAGGGVNKVVALLVVQNGEELWKLARKSRTEDVLVYLALSNFRKRFLRREIPLRIRHDIRSFFGDLTTAQAKARDLLFAAGDAGEIELACEGLDLGWQDEDALLIHRSLLDRLPPILRIYVHCAAHRYGDPTQADLIKIHKHSGKVTFQQYDDFDGKPLPELQTRIKVNLRNLFVEVFDHSKGPRIQLLYFKERFVGRTYPGRPAMEKFSVKLCKLGLDPATIGLGPDKLGFQSLLDGAGLNEKLNPTRKRSMSSAP
jgi:DNA phosphorothioation-associated putative methyltransferase